VTPIVSLGCGLLIGWLVSELILRSRNRP